MASAKQVKSVPRALPDTAYEWLRNGILTRRLSPGVQLKERDIALELGISRTPLRQALMRLIAEGLATQVPNVGIFVRQLSMGQAEELLGVRRILEAGAAAAAAERITDSGAQDLVALARDVDDAFRRKNQQDLNLLEYEFHTRVMQLTGNSELRALAEKMHTIHLTVSVLEWPRRNARNDSEMSLSHVDVAQAIGSGDAARAFQAMWRHFIVLHDSIHARLLSSVV